MPAAILPVGWFRGVEEAPDSTYQQSLANTADARLAALKENQAKHAQIALEAYQGKYQKGTNFQEVSDQKQVVLDKPAQDYFMRSWFRPTNDNAGVGNSELAEQLFQQNKRLVKENYKLATDLGEMHATNQALSDLVNIKMPTGPLGVLSTARQMHDYVGADRGSQTQVNNAVYKYKLNPSTYEYEVVRSGTPNEKMSYSEFNGETPQQVADRIVASNIAVKPTNSADLTTMLKRENSALANRAIPEAQRLKIDSEGLVNLAGTAATAGVMYAGLRMGKAN